MTRRIALAVIGFGVPLARASMVVIGIAGSTAPAQSLTGLGLLPGGTYSTTVGVSADGSAVVGWGDSSSGPMAFRWTRSGGMVGLGMLAGGVYSIGWAISGNGAVVAGVSDSSDGQFAFRWTGGEGMVSLGWLTGGDYSTSSAVNGDGSVVVGLSVSSDGGRAFRWTHDTGMVSLGVLPGGTDYTSNGRGVSSDGLVVVGEANDPDGAGGLRAFRWTSDWGMVSLGVLSGGTYSSARGANSDGSVVVGDSESSGGDRGFRWTSDGGMVSLGVLSEGDASYAAAVNGDGSSVVGGSGTASNGGRAVLWNAILGVVDLNTYLPTLGIDLTGWTLGGAGGISGDGRTIVGGGRHNGIAEAWVAVLPPCPIVSGGQNATACIGGMTTLSITVTGPGPFSYHWRFNAAPINTVTNPSAATTTLILNNVSAANAGSYDCVVSTICGHVTSNPATITICDADFNCSGAVSVQDIFDFLASYFAGEFRADFNGSHSVTVQDIFDFLRAYFAGCS